MWHDPSLGHGRHHKPHLADGRSVEPPKSRADEGRPSTIYLGLLHNYARCIAPREVRSPRCGAHRRCLPAKTPSVHIHLVNGCRCRSQQTPHPQRLHAHCRPLQRAQRSAGPPKGSPLIGDRSRLDIWPEGPVAVREMASPHWCNAAYPPCPEGSNYPAHSPTETPAVRSYRHRSYRQRSGIHQQLPPPGSDPDDPTGQMTIAHSVLGEFRE